MQQATDLINREKTNSGASSASPERYSPSVRQKKLVSALWDRMGQLYGSKWASQEGRILTEGGHPTPRFLLWCRKTEGLKDDAWARGFEQIEYKVREAARNGETAWPPSYAGFLGFCDKPPGSQALNHFKPLGLEDKTTREKRRKLGLEKCSKLKNLFD